MEVGVLPAGRIGLNHCEILTASTPHRNGPKERKGAEAAFLLNLSLISFEIVTFARLELHRSVVALIVS